MATRARVGEKKTEPPLGENRDDRRAATAQASLPLQPLRLSAWRTHWADAENDESAMMTRRAPPRPARGNGRFLRRALGVPGRAAPVARRTLVYG